jgi:hypothetical protein
MKSPFSIPESRPDTAGTGWALPIVAALIVLVLGVAMVATECRVSAAASASTHSVSVQ